MVNIDKPKFDLRNFFGGKLENNIKYAVVHDITLEKSFVTIAVNVGSYSNPKDYDGLAHFLEHMLFMGSHKYPDEKYYFEELNKLGGYSNAYTSTMETVYYFDVFDDGLEKMIDIFSRFFIDPLFNEDSISREMNAVDNEHQKNINSDNWRKWQFMVDIINKDSIMNNFGTGSLKTLNKKNIRNKMIEFYEKFYTTDNISICIASSKSPLQIKHIIDNTFGIIKKSKCLDKLKLNKPFYSENNLNTYHLKSLTNIHEVYYIYEIPEEHKYVKSRYFVIFQMILVNKSDKSLYYDLKTRGFLENVYVELKEEGILEIQLILTKEGLDNIEFVESTLYQAIFQINNLDIAKHAEYFKKILKINYNTIHKLDSTDICNMLAVSHFYHNTKNIYRNNFIIRKIKTTDEYQNKFKKYINNENVIKIIMSQSFLNQKIKYNKTKEYNTDYALLDFKIKINNYNNVFYDRIDTNNEYLNVEPRIIKNLDRYDIPELISNNIWYGGCSKFGEPFVIILLQINNNTFYNNPINYILTKLSCIILNYLINIIMYKPFELPYSISFSSNASSSSININISGLNDIEKLKQLLEELNIFLFNTDLTKITDKYIENLIISLKEAYENINFLNPSEYSNNKINSVIYNTEYPVEQLIDAIKTINIEQIKFNVKSILNNSSITSFVYGNIDKIHVPELLKSYNKYLINNNETECINNITDINVIHPNKDEKSNCITLFYPMGDLDIKNNDSIKIILGIVGVRILSQIFFDELRTKNQLGYLVNMKMISYRNKYYITQKIQSNKTIDIILDKINNFNNNISKYLLESDFNEFISSIKKELLENDYSLNDKINKYLPEIINHEFIFNRKLILSKQIDKITKEDVNGYFKVILSKSINVIINGN